ncbi:monooxygenase [Podospora didyma]|uniref:Monooxygenase n=1 Tax=Podospora didyma TaxID=330526 RepID=A0AAE0N1S3_9PEZI|nr:monooxygenase [Podospora didyma]
MRTQDLTSDLHLPRILCLHGGGSNARIFRAQCRVLSSYLRGSFRLVFADAPLPFNPGPDVVSVYQTWGPFRGWIPPAWIDGVPEKDMHKTHSAMAFVEDVLEAAMDADDCQTGATGPWVGIMGFSQGAKIAASLLLRQQQQMHAGILPRFAFRFGILMAGRGPLLSGTCTPSSLQARSEVRSHSCQVGGQTNVIAHVGDIMCFASPVPGHVDPRFEIAIVGGGIVGLITAMGLLKRNIPVKIYEQSRSFREIGAGVAFTANARRCMSLIDPAIVDAINAVATPNGEDDDAPSDYLRYHDGYTWDPSDPEGTDDKLLFRLDTGRKGFQGCHRAHLLDELVKSIPDNVVAFRKRLTSYTDRGRGHKLLLHFEDGTSAEADAVIGCDGIKSKIRQLILGADNPASYPHFSHKVAYRALIPMDRVVDALGRFKGFNQHMHTGPEAHVLHFPVAAGKFINFVAFANDESDWDFTHMTAPAKREEVAAIFKGWGPTVTRLIGLLPDELDKWAIFDTYDHPAPTFVSGRVCLAGDAAHASSPHHGAGAGIGVEDALALATVLEKALATVNEDPSQDPYEIVEAAFELYNRVRPARGQWLVQSSREACEIYEWNYPGTMRDWDKCLAEIQRRSYKLWYFDIEGMLKELEDGYETYFPKGDRAGFGKAVGRVEVGEVR